MKFESLSSLLLFIKKSMEHGIFYAKFNFFMISVIIKKYTEDIQNSFGTLINRGVLENYHCTENHSSHKTYF